MAYAKRTTVPVDKSRLEIERTLTRYGADRFAYFTEGGRAIIVFEANNRRLRFDLPLPEGVKNEQARRSKWRALLLCIKAKLEAVEAKIETFESAFLAHVVLPDGRTVGQAVTEPIARAYAGHMPNNLLPDYSARAE